MQILNEYDKAITNYILAMADGTVTQEIRDAVSATVEDLDTAMTAANEMIQCVNGKLYDKALTPDEALELAQAEYKQLGLERELKVEFLTPALTILFRKAEFVQKSKAQRAEQIADVFRANRDCPVERVRNGINIFCLRMLHVTGTVTSDMAFTRQLMEEINKLDDRAKTDAIVPYAIFTEF
jgi:hypothetical protein